MGPYSMTRQELPNRVFSLTAVGADGLKASNSGQSSNPDNLPS